MRFQYKIIFVTLAILVATLLLNSVLSLASFEKIYVASLISMYEVARIYANVEDGLGRFYVAHPRQ